MRRPALDPEPDSALDRIRDRLLTIAGDDGHVTILDPDLCIYRLRAPTTLHKAVTFGVTLSLIVQGTKHLRIGDHELTVPPQSLLVITRDTEETSIAACAAPDRPFLALSFCFGPERVARALLAITEAGGHETRSAET